MIGWIKNTTNGMERKKIEPGATFSALEDHWKQITAVMTDSQDADGAEAVISHFGQMISFLRIARVESNSDNTCKAFWLQNKCSDEVLKWLHHLQIQGIQFPSSVETKLVTMLHSLCEVASKDEELLGYMNITDGEAETIKNEYENWDGAYSLASLLLEYSIRTENNLGETARYCFILLIQLTSKYPRLEQILTEGTGRGLTNVVISGLSACFSTLPTFTDGSRDQLRAFTTQLRFVDEVCKASSPSIASTISECFLNAFLLSVIQPALTQSLNEEIAIVTYYYQVVCEQLTHPCLIRSLMSFTNTKLLPTLIQRMGHSSPNVVVSTLRLFNVLLEFFCEDFWYECILQHLVPENHLMVSQRNTQLQEIDFHESSIRFLSLVPYNIVNCISPELLTTHYLHYLSSESQRFVNTVFLVTNSSSTVPTSFSSSISDKDSEDEESRPSNLLYPLWKFKYDGTDRAPSVIEHGGITQECTNTNEGQGINANAMDPLHTGNDEEIKIEHGIHVRNQHAPNKEYGQNSNAEPSSTNGLPSHQIASFGEFIDSIFVQLSRWPHLDLQVILALTEVVSTIAASRIPLITSLLLDSNITLQPYYVTFTSLLKRIRDELEYHLHECPHHILLEVWSKVDDGNDENERRSSSGMPGPTNAVSLPRQTPHSTANDFGENLIQVTKTVSSTMRSLFGRRTRASTSTDSNSPTNTNTRNIQSSSVGFTGQEARYIVHQGHQQAPAVDDAKKVMSLRAIYFSHWIFELAAVCQQLCWKNI